MVAWERKTNKQTISRRRNNKQGKKKKQTQKIFLLQKQTFCFWANVYSDETWSISVSLLFSSLFSNKNCIPVNWISPFFVLFVWSLFQSSEQFTIVSFPQFFSLYAFWKLCLSFASCPKAFRVSFFRHPSEGVFILENWRHV